MPLHKPSGLRREPKFWGSRQDPTWVLINSALAPSSTTRAIQHFPVRSTEQQVRDLIAEIQWRTASVQYILKSEMVVAYKSADGKLPADIVEQVERKAAEENERIEWIKAKLLEEWRNVEAVKPRKIIIETIPSRDKSAKTITRTRWKIAYITDQRLRADLTDELTTAARELLDAHNALRVKLTSK